jgi:polyribonucleotide nucleotidyltransferase
MTRFIFLILEKTVQIKVAGSEGINNMKFKSRLTLLIVLMLSSLTIAIAQNSSVENLRSQLSDMQTKETQLQDQMKQLDEDLKPENIEKVFALNGSTHPEELREQRRKQLEAQKANVQAQLDQIATSRTRIEAAISSAEAAAVRQNVVTTTTDQPAATSNSTSSSTSSPAVKPKSRRRTHRKRARSIKSQE